MNNIPTSGDPKGYVTIYCRPISGGPTTACISNWPIFDHASTAVLEALHEARMIRSEAHDRLEPGITAEPVDLMP